MLVLMLIGMLCLSSCRTETYNQSLCPIYPLAGRAVAKELSEIPAAENPATWEWIGRINKLRQELELCRQPKT